MELTMERFGFTFDLRDIFLSLQMRFSFVRVALACAILRESLVWSHHLKQLLQGT